MRQVPFLCLKQYTANTILQKCVLHSHIIFYRLFFKGFVFFLTFWVYAHTIAYANTAYE